MSSNTQNGLADNETPEEFTSPRSSSPIPPHWSPITPTAEPADLCNMIPDDLQLTSLESEQGKLSPPAALATQDYVNAIYQKPSDVLPKQPESVSMAEDENLDAIALRAALDILQLQRQKATLDIRKLRHQKDEALADPEAFVRGLSCSSFRDDIKSKTPAVGILCSGSMQQAAHPKSMPHAVDTHDKDLHSIEAIPSPQNVIRCPPINWAKYSVNGESLENTHTIVRKGTNLRTQEGASRQNADQPGIFLAGPYRPYID